MQHIQLPHEDPLTQTTASPAATEHLAHLPKMSPTAGVGVQEYVAVNVAAVVSLLIGFASMLAIMADELVVIPLAAIITAVIALRQINDSNGTQTGAGIATAGLFLAVSITSYVAAAQTLDYVTHAPDRKAIQQLCQHFGQDVRDGTYDAAYDLFSNHFKNRVSRQEFVLRLQSRQEQLKNGLQNGTTRGPVVGIHWDGVAAINTDLDVGTVTAQADFIVEYQNPGPDDPVPATFRKSANIWLIDDIQSWFPSAKAKG